MLQHIAMFILSQVCVLAFTYFVYTKADNCQDCVHANRIWCAEKSQCYRTFFGFSLQALFCTTTITDDLNCPMYPQSGYEYSDNFARTVALPLIAAVYADDPADCVGNNFPSACVYSTISVDCPDLGPDTNCYAYTVVDPSKNAIFVAFKGTFGTLQLIEEFLSYFESLSGFLGVGNIYDYFFDSFNNLWNGGLGNATQQLHDMYPNYQIWVFGHSLGGAQASIYASYLIKTGMYTPQQVRLLTFGQPRTGDRDFAKWHDQTFLYSYRVVHKQDIVPHIPPNFGIDALWHHRYEVWYDNDMAVGQSYAVCPESDGLLYCSNRKPALSVSDHSVYFNVNLGDFARQGCPKQ